MEVVANPSSGQEASFVRQQRQTCATGHGLNASCWQPPAKALWSGERLLAVMLFGFLFSFIAMAGNQLPHWLETGRLKTFIDADARGRNSRNGEIWSFYQLLAADDYCFVICTNFDLWLSSRLYFWECLDEKSGLHRWHVKVIGDGWCRCTSWCQSWSGELPELLTWWLMEPVGGRLKSKGKPKWAMMAKYKKVATATPQWTARERLVFKLERVSTWNTGWRRLDDFDFIKYGNQGRLR